MEEEEVSDFLGYDMTKFKQFDEFCEEISNGTLTGVSFSRCDYNHWIFDALHSPNNRVERLYIDTSDTIWDLEDLLSSTNCRVNSLTLDAAWNYMDEDWEDTLEFLFQKLASSRVREFGMEHFGLHPNYEDAMHHLSTLITNPNSPIRTMKLRDVYGNYNILYDAVRSPNCNLREIKCEYTKVSEFPNHRDAMIALTSARNYRRLGRNSHARVLPLDALKLMRTFLY